MRPTLEAPFEFRSAWTQFALRNRPDAALRPQSPDAEPFVWPTAPWRGPPLWSTPLNMIRRVRLGRIHPSLSPLTSSAVPRGPCCVGISRRSVKLLAAYRAPRCANNWLADETWGTIDKVCADCGVCGKFSQTPGDPVFSTKTTQHLKQEIEMDLFPMTLWPL